jgi:hypothetical protein
MKLQRISHLNAQQLQAVFNSDRFLELSDAQLAALHHRSEQLQAHRQLAQLKRRRRVLMAAAVLAALMALAPFWQVVLALGAAAAFWMLVAALLWDAGQKLRRSIAGASRRG